MTESILVNHDQAKNLKEFVKKLGDFFAMYKGYNTAYTYNNYLSRLNKARLNKYKANDINDLQDNLKIYKILKAAGFYVINF